MSFVRQAWLTLFSRGFLLIISLVYRKILSDFLGADGLGIVEPLRSYGLLAQQFGNLGLAVGAIYFIGLDKTRASKISGTLMTSGLIISALMIGLFFIIGNSLPTWLGNVNSEQYEIGLIMIPPLVLLLFAQNLLLAYQKIAEFNYIEIAVRGGSVIAAILIFYSVESEFYIIAIIWLTVITAILMALFNIYWAYKEHPFGLRFSLSEFKELFGYGWKSYYATFMGFIIGKSDILFMNSMRSVSETGIYGQVLYIGDFVYMIPMTIGMLLFPKLMQEGESERTGLDDRARLTMLVSRLIAAIMVFMWLVFLVIGKPFLGFFGEAFIPGYIPLLIFLGGLVFLGVEVILASELARRGLPIFVVIYSTIIMALKISANVILIPKYGMYGAAWSSLITYAVFLAIVLWYCVKNYGFSISDTLFIKRGDFTLIFNRMFSRTDTE